MQKPLISWGAGVNSTAIIALHLLNPCQGKPEIVFADTGCELPETYAYIDSIKKILPTWKFTTLSPETHPDLYDPCIKGRCLYNYCLDKKTFPTIQHRFCNTMFKTKPLKKYAGGRPYMIGICKDELHRKVEGNIYPVADFSREMCVGLIAAAGLPPAHKTGCHICPMQTKADKIALYKNNRPYWNELVRLEAQSETTYRPGISLPAQMEKWLKEEKNVT